MDMLYKLQLTCFIFMVMNAAALALTRLHVRWVSKRYEQSRWLLCVSMFLMAVQYLLQMRLGIRASSDEVAAVVNMLFYTPCFALFAMAIYNLVVPNARLLRYVSGNAVLYALIIVMCVVACMRNGSLHMGGWIYVMLGLFLLSMTHSITILIREIRKRKKVLEKETMVDMSTYARYSNSSLAVLFAAVYLVPCSISSSKLLIMCGPLVLIAVFFFLVTFVSLGFNNAPAESMISTEEVGSHEGYEPEGAEVQAVMLSDERMDDIRQRLEGWCASCGYKDGGVNMLSLSRSLCVPKSQLSIYFEKGEHCTFRVWLSDIRFKAAQTMMLEHPDYSNDVISSECGFSSRSYLYRIFKERVGVTPTEWREEQTGLVAASSGE